MKRLVFVLLAAAMAVQSRGQTSFAVLGDLHVDRFEFHDMDYVYTRPSDWWQVTREYPCFTAAYYPKLFDAVARRMTAGCAALVQLGDLMEGVAGNDSLALRMARYAVGAIDRAACGRTVLLTKGNHDVSASPGQPEAWRQVVLPYIERQTGQHLANGMYRYTLDGQADFFVAEQFFSPDEMLPEAALLEFLKRELPRSTARCKFLLTHQPVVPVTERCWHLFSGIRRPVGDPAVREELLELLAANRVTVLCAHLHRYSKCVRRTDRGNLVQLMMVSTVDSFACEQRERPPQAYPNPEALDPEWQPRTLDVRRAILAAEAPRIAYFTCCYRPGHAVVEVSDEGARFSFYDGYADTPSESFMIDELYEL